MKLPRREFLKTSLAASATAALTSSLPAAASDRTTAREFYELRAYRLKPDTSRRPLESYLESALLPALDRRGLKNIGVFTELKVNRSAATSTPLENSPLWVLIPHPTLESFVAVSAELNADPAVQTAGAEYLGAPKTAPGFDRIDSWLLRAFRSMPQMEIPEFVRRRVSTRVFELRSYESYSEAKALKKMAMFDDGETQVMRDVELAPVFFGQALAGQNLPHLSYATSAPDLASHLAHWKNFGTHPDWAKLRDDPQYADTVSKNTPHFLAPTAYSQL